MKIAAITCNTMHLDGGSMYGHIPKTLWEKWTPADALNRVQLSCRALFLQTDDGRNILFDVGLGDSFDPKLKERYGVDGNLELLRSLEKMGIRERDIDIIILSHLHFDHACGLLSAYGERTPHLLFPNSKYYIGENHWNFARQPHRRERASFNPLLISLLENSDRLKLIENEAHPDLNFGISFDFSNGHTSGMMLSYLNLSSGLLVYASDLVPGLPWVHLPVTMGYDRYAELLVDEKERLLKRLINENGRILFTHDLHTSCGRVHQDENCNYFGEAVNLLDLV